MHQLHHFRVLTCHCRSYTEFIYELAVTNIEHSRVFDIIGPVILFGCISGETWGLNEGEWGLRRGDREGAKVFSINPFPSEMKLPQKHTHWAQGNAGLSGA